MGTTDESTYREFVSRVIYSLTQPAAQLADRFAGRFMFTHKELSHVVQLAYYQTKSRRGLTHKEIAKEFGTSTRTIDRLAKATRENFFAPEREHALPRRVEFLLWSGPKSAARLAQLLPGVSDDDLQGALSSLLKSGRIIQEQGRTVTYRGTRRANRLPDDSMAARFDALNNLLDTVFDTVWMRFFKQDDTRSGARTVGLRVRRADLPEIERLYEQAIWPRLVELDDLAREADENDVVELGMVVCWAPMGEEHSNEGDETA